MTRRIVQKQGWVFTLFSPYSDDRLSLKFYRFVKNMSCDTRSVGLGQYCLPKVSNDFKYASFLGKNWKTYTDYMLAFHFIGGNNLYPQNQFVISFVDEFLLIWLGTKHRYLLTVLVSFIRWIPDYFRSWFATPSPGEQLTSTRFPDILCMFPAWPNL